MFSINIATHSIISTGSYIVHFYHGESIRSVFYEALPYIEVVTDLLNRNLMDSFPRVSPVKFLREQKNLDDGRIIDNTNLWKGGAFLLFDGNNIIGASLAREEIIIDKFGNRNRTGRGFGLFAVVDIEYRNGIWGILLSGIAIDSLIQKGCNLVRGSTSIYNIPVDKLFSRFARTRWVEGEWIRYVVDTEKFSVLFYKLLESKGLKEQYNLIFL